MSWHSCKDGYFGYNQGRVYSILGHIQALLWSRPMHFFVSVTKLWFSDNDIHSLDIFKLILCPQRHSASVTFLFFFLFQIYANLGVFYVKFLSPLDLSIACIQGCFSVCVCVRSLMWRVELAPGLGQLPKIASIDIRTSRWRGRLNCSRSKRPGIWGAGGGGGGGEEKEEEAERGCERMCCNSRHSFFSFNDQRETELY